MFEAMYTKISNIPTVRKLTLRFNLIYSLRVERSRFSQGNRFPPEIHRTLSYFIYSPFDSKIGPANIAGVKVHF